MYYRYSDFRSWLMEKFYLPEKDVLALTYGRDYGGRCRFGYLERHSICLTTATNRRFFWYSTQPFFSQTDISHVAAGFYSAQNGIRFLIGIKHTWTHILIHDLGAREFGDLNALLDLVTHCGLVSLWMATHGIVTNYCFQSLVTSGLTFLNLAMNHLDIKSVESLAIQLRSETCQLARLKIRLDNNSSAASLFAALGHNLTLEKIYIFCLGINKSDFQVLDQALSLNQNMRKIALDIFYMHDFTLPEMSFLLHNHHLTHVSFRFAEGMPTALWLTNVSQNHTLTHLKILCDNAHAWNIACHEIFLASESIRYLWLPSLCDTTYNQKEINRMATALTANRTLWGLYIQSIHDIHRGDLYRVLSGILEENKILRNVEIMFRDRFWKGYSGARKFDKKLRANRSRAHLDLRRTATKVYCKSHPQSQHDFDHIPIELQHMIQKRYRLLNKKYSKPSKMWQV